MNKMRSLVSVLAICLLGSYLALAQNPGGGQGRGGGAPAAGGGAPQAPPQPMTFFATSAGSGKGADLGGLAGADAIC